MSFNDSILDDFCFDSENPNEYFDMLKEIIEITAF